MLETSRNENPEIFSSVDRDNSVIFFSIYHQPVRSDKINSWVLVKWEWSRQEKTGEVSRQIQTQARQD